MSDKPTELPLPSNLGLPPESDPSGRKGALSSIELHGIAKLAAQGFHSPTEIAAIVNRDPRTVRKLLTEDDDMRGLVEHYNARIVRTFCDMRFDMMEHLDHAVLKIKEGISSTNDKLAVDTSKWLIERFMPKQSQDINLNLNARGAEQLDPDSQVEVQQTFALVGAQLYRLNQAGADFSAHVRTGPDALPGATSLKKPDADDGPGNTS